MMSSVKRITWSNLSGLLITIAFLALSGCGDKSATPALATGATAASGVSATSGVPATVAVQTITGTVATGAALANALVTIKDSAGAIVQGNTAADGTFGLVVTGKKPPFMLQAASNSALGVYNLYSVLPALDMTITSTANVNITPITTLVMYELNGGIDPGNMFRNSTFTAIKTLDVGNAETLVRKRLASGLTASPSATLASLPSSFSFTYDTLKVGDQYDKALDSIGKITAYTSNGATLLTTNGVTTNYSTGTVAATVPTAASVQLLMSSTQMPSSGANPITLTAVVLDKNKQTMVGRPVSFSTGTDASMSTSDSTAYISNISGISDANGIVTAKLNLGSNKSIRTIYVTATADTAAPATGNIAVTGTKIAISGNTSLTLKSDTTLTLLVTDSAGAPIPDIKLGVASSNLNPIDFTPSNQITDATGQLVVKVTANNSKTTEITGTDTLTVTGAGTSQTETLTINNSSFNITAPVAVAPKTPEIPINLATPVSILWTLNGQPQAGKTINFYTSRGTFTPTSVVTDKDGVATASVSAQSTGATILTASGPGGTPSANSNVIFTTAQPNYLIVKANPSTIAFNTSGSTTNQSVISVIVRDKDNNLVKNAHVTFSQATDSSGGYLATGTATTDITGTASVNYIAGTISSAQGSTTPDRTQSTGVVINTTVDSVNGQPIVPVVSNSTTLTVASQSMFVRLGTDNTVGSTGLFAYAKSYIALVSDIAGNPVPDGTEVRFVLRPKSFSKGRYILNAAGTGWAKDPTVGITCPSEDLLFNGIVSNPSTPITATNPPAGTNPPIPPTGSWDINGNGRLDPSGVAVVNPTAKTVGGFATATISYAKEYATWVAFDLEARAGVVGNDPPNVVAVGLPGATADYTKPDTPPPGAISLFGVGASPDNVCTNTK